MRREEEVQWQQELHRIGLQYMREQEEQRRQQAHQQEFVRQQLLTQPHLYDNSYEQKQTDEFLHQDIKERLLETYDSEKTHTKQRWEQEQLDQLEGFALLEQLTLIQDEIEQTNQIEATQRLNEDENNERNTEELHQIESWEEEAFRLQQQLNQN